MCFVNSRINYSYTKDLNTFLVIFMIMEITAHNTTHFVFNISPEEMIEVLEDLSDSNVNDGYVHPTKIKDVFYGMAGGIVKEDLSEHADAFDYSRVASSVSYILDHFAYNKIIERGYVDKGRQYRPICSSSNCVD